ncbi:helix-turn-helix domain-containing protein [Actinomadura rayongensis]|uniref:PucR family transcriptional regulator n=1 Tax=Actinomadura rayongensis TaxID=1429076 RepID=A0A6I4W9F3_9ACTN|nr:helix-turn-helix domain-containing protein [Actinomadura rayongensis]MXQ66807.1 PucR family transcriptional regulator [Actinomadura rayongensis]
MTRPELDVRPFEAIPPGIVRRMRPAVAVAAAELADDATGPARADVRAWVGESLRLFYALVDDPRGAWPRVAESFRELGRGAALRGRDLDELHVALHRCARAVWRTLTASAESLDIDRATLGLLAEAQFTYLDAVTAEAAAGYEAERAGGDDAVRRRRARLLALLLDDGDPGDVADAARAARWRIPRSAAAVVLHPRADTGARPPVLPPDVLVDLARSEPCLVVPDPEGPGRARLLDALLADWIVVLGPALPPARAAESLRWARRAMALARRGRIAADGLVRCMDHVPTLVIFMAEDLIEHAADTRLAPLAGLSPVQTERLSETLLSLLESNFNATEAGNRLHVHPQTVRYRLRHLEELFGADLHDPGRCLELEMILHARHGAPSGRADAPVTRPRTSTRRLLTPYRPYAPTP